MINYANTRTDVLIYYTKILQEEKAQISKTFFESTNKKHFQNKIPSPFSPKKGKGIRHT
jgi:hypothetical protein